MWRRWRRHETAPRRCADVRSLRVTAGASSPSQFDESWTGLCREMCRYFRCVIMLALRGLGMSAELEGDGSTLKLRMVAPLLGWLRRPMIYGRLGTALATAEWTERGRQSTYGMAGPRRLAQVGCFVKAKSCTLHPVIACLRVWGVG